MAFVKPVASVVAAPEALSTRNTRAPPSGNGNPVSWLTQWAPSGARTTPVGTVCIGIVAPPGSGVGVFGKTVSARRVADLGVGVGVGVERPDVGHGARVAVAMQGHDAAEQRRDGLLAWRASGRGGGARSWP